jgi:hypothetical protein
LVVASFAEEMSPLLTSILSFLAAVSVALFSGFQIGERATKFREAWKLYNAARLEYEHNLVDEKFLTQAYRRGEEIIGQLKPYPFRNGRPEDSSL